MKKKEKKKKKSGTCRPYAIRVHNIINLLYRYCINRLTNIEFVLRRTDNRTEAGILVEAEQVSTLLRLRLEKWRTSFEAQHGDDDVTAPSLRQIGGCISATNRTTKKDTNRNEWQLVELLIMTRIIVGKYLYAYEVKRATIVNNGGVESQSVWRAFRNPNLRNNCLIRVVRIGTHGAIRTS